jgi:hypothetical protein
MRLKPLVILHFVLRGVETKASPAKMVHEFLNAFYKDNGSLTYIEIEFDLSDKKSQKDHAKKLDKLVAKLEECVSPIYLLFIQY